MVQDSSDQAEILDLRGLKCPMPALLLRRRLTRAQSGEEFRVLANDGMAHIDLPHAAMQAGAEIVWQGGEDGGIALHLRAGGGLPLGNEK
ncbi:MAG TPA: hypothetical protein DCL54_00040 [Alphaproteobacteria bacterium]|nr:hypothetical protein [Alphaproteobacteria bacterium]HAJ44954.1 hypothetical protein [Alphaproteobacteria bacterium]